MNKTSRLLLLVGLAGAFGVGPPFRDNCREAAILARASEVLCEVPELPCNRVAMSLLRNAQGVAIFPCVLRAAAGLGIRHGRGVLLIRGADGNWEPPVFLTLSGASLGVQLGVEGAHLVLVFRTQSSLEWMHKGKVTLDAGSMLAVGSFGRENSLGTDVGLKTTILSASHSAGVCAGVYTEGAFLHINTAATNAYYQYEKGYLQNHGLISPAGPPSVRLQMKLEELSAAAPVAQTVAPSHCAAPSSPQP